MVNKPNFFNLYEDKNEIECAKSNNKILKAFYIFIIIIIKNFLIFKNNKGEQNSSDRKRKSSDRKRKSSDSKIKSSDSKRKSSDSENIPESRIPSFVIDINEEENFQVEDEDKILWMEDKFFQMEDNIFQKKDKIFHMQDKNSQIKKKLPLSKESGQIFKEKFMKTSKYNSFVIKFYQNNESNDINKIPYKFINEFNYYIYFCKELKEIIFLKIIEQFYGKIKLLDFEEISNKMQGIEIKQEEKKREKIKQQEKRRQEMKQKKREEIKHQENKRQEIKHQENKRQENKKKIKAFNYNTEEEIIRLNINKYDKDLQNIYLFSVDNFFLFYQEKLRFIINREQEDDKENFSKIKSNSRLYKKYKRNNFLNY